MTRILIVSDHFSTGGVATVSRRLGKGLVSKGYDVEFLSAFLEHHSSVLDDISIHSIKSSSIERKLIFPLLNKLLTFFKNNEYDVIISNKDHVNFYVILSLFLCRNRPMVICNSHNTVSELFKRPTWQLYKVILFGCKYLYKKVDFVANVSKEAALDSKVFFDLDEVVYLPNPVFDELPSLSLDKTVNPFEHDNVINILACGRLEYQKNYSFMLFSFKLFLESQPNSNLTILGDGSLRETLNNLILELGISKKVHILGSVGNVGEYMRYADCLWMTSFYEGLPTVLIEALSYGCPVVSVNCHSGPKEIIEQYCGILVEGYDEVAHTEALLSVLGTRTMYADVRRNRVREFLTQNATSELLKLIK